MSFHNNNALFHTKLFHDYQMKKETTNGHLIGMIIGNKNGRNNVVNLQKTNKETNKITCSKKTMYFMEHSILRIDSKK